MATGFREKRVQELGESAYLLLKETYRGLGTLRGLIRDLHDCCLKEGGSLDFDKVEAMNLTMEQIYGELERYLLPECDPDSAYDDAMAEPPGTQAP